MLVTEEVTTTLQVVLLADPGWYPAPGESGVERRWTGSAWSDDRRGAAGRRAKVQALAASAFGCRRPGRASDSERAAA